jgi:RecB family exonuclease
MGDAARRREGLRTSAELEEEEPRLFELAAARATGKIIFSYSRFNEKGEDAVPSFFLDRNGLDLNGVEFCDTRVHPQPIRQSAAAVPGSVGDADLLAQLAKTHQALAPTSIETFLQCPFQFFAAKTLRLRPRPKTPRERLDVLLQGSILHRALAEVSRAPLLGAAIFDEVFEEECRRARVPANYRTEAVRLEMRRHFDAFLADAQVVLGWASRVEEKFSFALNPLLTLRGRVDRLDVGPGKETLVIDYKYSAANRIRERTDEDQAGNLVQGGLYLLAAERQFGLKPAGMLYCGLRKGVVWAGWHVSIPGLERIGEAVSREQLQAITRAAADKAVGVFEAIASGSVAARPADEKKCAWCDFADICRVESLGAKKAAPA